MLAKLRLVSALCALIAAVMVVWQANPAGAPRVDAGDIPMTNVTTSIKWPVIETTDPSPFNPCKQIPLEAVQALGLTFTPPTPEDQLRCRYDAGNYQLAVEAIVWRTYEQTLPTDAVQLDIDGHRAAQYWVMKPTDWNNRWWITCMIAFDTSYGVLQQSLFYSPIYSEPDPDCMQTNLQRAHELIPHYVF
ncbi:hypothetical protein AU197_15230 [Mycobacterium sp. IS-1590]|uniref:DUF3558 domain-containing protein n=1 Tax=Mycobacterium sp. IS-1590 TaxID=1772286 RepID=UPI000747E84B|nr:DUF3558 domain-containing protein [Mycobacterium sp. IS-1590]KUI42444.1 hypothetical protein AU197_15230 [Mycobacterium sp. IS-1590]